MSPDGTQRTMPSGDPAAVPPPFAVTSVRGTDLARHLDATRESMLAHGRGPDAWPLHEIRVTRLPDGTSLVHACFDLLGLDAGSIARVMSDLAALHADPAAETGGDYNKIPWRLGLLTQTD